MGKIPAVQKPADSARLENKFALHHVMIVQGVVSSLSADWRRTIAHESSFSIRFPSWRTPTHIESVAALRQFVKLGNLRI